MWKVVWGCLVNLIEQLGGYEKASRELGLKEKNSVLQCCIAVTAEMIREALLKHRREHNIFEVGDCVVKTDPKIKHAHVRVVISTSPSGGAVLDYQGFPYKFPCVRHATEEEIKVGRRL